MKAQPFPLSDVRLLAGPVKTAQETNLRCLKEWDPERLLHTFRVNAGLPSSAKPLGGWEAPDCELRGHFTGHYLSALALMYASTGDPEMKRRGTYMVAELAKCQKAIGTGYLSAFPDSFFDRVEQSKPVWAPYYTIHKIMAGLIDQYRLCRNRQARDVARGLADYFDKRCRKLSEEQMQRMLRAEYGGMAESLYDLYACTHYILYVGLGNRFHKTRFLDALVEGRDELRGLHVNTHIPQVIAAARGYELADAKRLRDASTYFWDEVALHRAYCTGGTSNYEAWRTAPDHLASELSFESQETCCTYNMLRLTRHLFCWDPEPKYADYYERALWNGILPTQEPGTGMTMYYVCLKPGGWKVFSTPNDSFWCCTGTGAESFSKLGDSIYFHDDAGVWVNLFIPSVLKWPEKGLTLRQTTRFPASSSTSFTITAAKPTIFAIRLRIPYWASHAIVKVNGKPVRVAASPSSYAVLNRTWRTGDRVDLSLPMSLHLAPMPDDPTLAAVMYGPLVLAGKLGTEGLTDRAGHVLDQRAYEGKDIEVPPFVVPAIGPSTWLKPVTGKPLAFATGSTTLVPFFQLFGERYSVYWRVFEKDSPAYKTYLAEQERAKALKAREIDRVLIGNRRSERTHNQQGERTNQGPFGGRTWRDADRGWFSYDLSVPPDRPVVLLCTFWGDEDGPRTFDILIGGQIVATQTLSHNQPGRFFDVEIPIPASLTSGKSSITVRFQAHEGNIAGGVFGVATLKPTS